MSERISQLIDDELGDELLNVVLAELKDEEVQYKWMAYHQISDHLRGEPILSDDFRGNLLRRLEAEPPIISSISRRASLGKVHKWIYSFAASFVAISFVGWVGWHSLEGRMLTMSLSAQSKPASTESMPFTADVGGLPPADEYFAVHEEYASASVLHGVSPYVRVVNSSAAEGF